MARLEPIDIDKAAPEIRPLMEDAARAMGQPLTSVGIQARCPTILEASRALGAAPGKSNTLPADLRWLVSLRAAQIVECPF